jgi:diguanylate cyclase (GGDEF)-like protein/PAS domain S-box-containing protein
MINEPTKILLVEDNQSDALAIKIMLESAEFSFELQRADTLKSGLKILSEKQMNIILLDLGLPDSKGLDTFIKVHDEYPDVPIVMYTGLEDEDLAVKALQKGAQDYLVKGKVDSRLLVRAIKYSIERHRLRVELKRMSAELEKSETRFHSLIDRSSDGILIVDNEGIIQYVNPAAEKIFCKEAKELIDKKFKFSFESGETKMIDIPRGKGEIGKAEMRVMQTELRGSTFYIVDLKDMTEIVEHVEEKKMLREMTLRDELTGLYNRRGFYTHAEQLIKVSKRNNENVILFFIDVDNLKSINDTYSHQSGDDALVDTTNIIKKTFRESDIIARFGGDEFVILARLAKKSLGDKLANRFKRNLNSHNKKDIRPYKLSLSLGLAMGGPKLNTSIDELLKKADESMYEQKEVKKEKL